MKIFSLLSALLFLNSCRHTLSEDPTVVARSFCDCLQDRLAHATDSSVNMNECNVVFYNSRFMKIHLLENRDVLNEATLDSADKFFIDVGNMIDTMCLNTIDERKLEPRRGL